ncbi:hypothetical protein [Psychromonas sp. KJ10-2]|uniref:hypothetical protein n=1 Tax=Psychromonas sp. KJ10-2 TaxID=3391822 RepID=UPI0039B59D36
MKIHNKLFLVFFGFSLVLVTALVLLIQWSIGKGIIEYVNSKEVEALKPLVAVLEDEYKKIIIGKVYKIEIGILDIYYFYIRKV